jgi:hypothetical protein
VRGTSREPRSRQQPDLVIVIAAGAVLVRGRVLDLLAHLLHVELLRLGDQLLERSGR